MPHNGGRLQQNLWFSNGYIENWAINVVKQMGSVFFAWDDVSQADVTTGAYVSDWPFLLNSDGYPTAMPPGTNPRWIGAQVWIWGDVGDTWDLVYPPQHTVTLASSSNIVLTESIIASGHKRYTISGTPPWNAGKFSALCQIRITAMSGSDWSEGIQCYATKLGGVATGYADLLASGEIFLPDFLARCGYGETPFGKIRFMDWQATNSNINILATHLRSASNVSWISPRVDSTTYAGTATKSGNAYTTGSRLPGNPATWTHGQVVQFMVTAAPEWKAVTAVTLGNPTVLAIASHGLSNGNEICTQAEVAGSQWIAALVTKDTATGLQKKYAVTVVDENNISIPLDSTGYAAATVPFNITQIVTVSDGTLSAKRCFRPGWNAFFYNDFATEPYQSSKFLTGVYHADIDAIELNTPSSRGDLNSGVPISVMCALCNKLGAHGFFNIPVQMTGADERALIQDVVDNLDIALCPDFEKGNEVWSSAFNAFYQNVTYSAINYGNLSFGNGYGKRVVETAANAATVIGDSRPYRVLMGAQAVSNASANENSFVDTPLSGGNPALYPINKVDGIAISHYCGPSFQFNNVANYPGFLTCIQNWKDGNKVTAYEWFSAETLRASSDLYGNPATLYAYTKIGGYLPNWISGLSAYVGRHGTGIEIHGYEGGITGVCTASWYYTGLPSAGITTSDVDNFFAEYVLSENFALSAVQCMTAIKNNGYAWVSNYALTGGFEASVTWGSWINNDWDSTETRHWRRLLNYNRGTNTFRLNTT